VSIVLASQSTSRARLLKAAGIEFETVPAKVDEDELKRSLTAAGQGVEAIADALAELKAIRVSTARPQDLVIGADQALSLEDELISKCAGLDEAAALLRRLRGRRHVLIGGLVLAKGGAPIWRHRSQATLSMRRFSDEFLADYLAREGAAILDAVGCYRLEATGAQLFDAIDGDYFAILGLALLPLLAALREQGAIAT
jgi:nucleoside triphosphate pyrophosphatase